MKPHIEAALRLVRNAMGTEQHTTGFLDVEGLFQTAHDNGLSGLVYDTLDAAWVSPQTYAKFRKDYFQYLKRDTLQQEAIKQIGKAFQAALIDHVFLKGTHLKQLYPQPYWRSMGDIDILIRPEQMPKAHQIMDSLQFVNSSNSFNHDTFEKGIDVVVEIHPKLDSEFNDKYDALFLDTWANTVVSNGVEYQFRPEYELVYLLYHLAKHFSSSGVGLRSVLDIGVYLSRLGDSLQLETLRQLLEATKLTLFYHNMVLLNEQLFGYHLEPYHLSQETLNHDFLERLTEYLAISGVHGKGVSFNTYLAGMAGQSIGAKSAKKGKLAYIMKLIFPSRKSLRSTYPYLVKAGFLLPIAWISRWFRLVFKQTKRSLRNLKRLKVDDSSVGDTADLYRKLGL
jgi:hypothetical protein